ncbi:MAG TPA: hypothetical protein VIX86_06790 [Streptosporangiaceae bacterium]
MPVAKGGTGQATDPLTSFEASDAAYLAWNYDPQQISTQTALPTTGQVVLSRINLRQAISVTNVLYYVGTIGSTLTSGQCFAGLYSSAGTLIGASADQSVAWAATTGLYTSALASGPFAAGPGFVWVALMFNGTTGPAAGRALAAGFATSNLGFAAAVSRYAHGNVTGTTSLPTQTPASLTATATQYWCALS